METSAESYHVSLKLSVKTVLREHHDTSESFRVLQFGCKNICVI